LNKKSRPGAAQQSKIIVAQKLKRSGPDQLILRLASLGPATIGGADGLAHSGQALIGMLDLSPSVSVRDGEHADISPGQKRWHWTVQMAHKITPKAAQ